METAILEGGKRLVGYLVGGGGGVGCDDRMPGCVD